MLLAIYFWRLITIDYGSGVNRFDKNKGVLSLSRRGLFKNIDIEIRQRRDYININLFDTGTGFKNKKTKDLIKPYFTTKQKGTGLGLSIVDKIISDHNGSINFLNQNNGAKIQIIIPNK